MANNEEQHWWFVVRRTILSKWATQLEAGCAVLDVGAGAGRQSILLKEIHGLAVKSLELSSAGVEYCLAKNLDVIQADATKIPFGNEIFDGVIAMDILEHIPDDQLAIQELARVMKSGASLFVTVPAFPFLWSKHDEKVSHVRRYRKSEIESLVKNNGLKIVNIRYWNSILFPIGVITRLLSLDNSKMTVPPRLLNQFLKKLTSTEAKFQIFGKLPGITLIVEAKK